MRSIGAMSSSWVILGDLLSSRARRVAHSSTQADTGSPIRGTICVEWVWAHRLNEVTIRHFVTQAQVSAVPKLSTPQSVQNPSILNKTKPHVAQNLWRIQSAPSTTL